jgi:hypothetical protein
MRRDNIDFFYIAEDQLAMHARLENWARYVAVRTPHWVSPTWRQGKSNGRQWHEPEIKAEVNTLDGHELEKGVAALPWQNRDCIRWAYVFKTPPWVLRKQKGFTEDDIYTYIKAGRRMLINRRV